MSRYFTPSVAAMAMMSMLAGPLLAQTAPAAPEASHGQSEAQVVLPQVLRDAGLTDISSKETRHGQRVSGKLPDGTAIGAMLDRDGKLRGLRAQDDAAIPRALIDQLVPQAVRNQPIFAELGAIDAIFLGERGVMLSGKDAQSNSVRAGFAEDGTLMRFGRGDDDRRGHGMDHRMGRGDDGDHRGGKHRGHDERGKGPRHGDDGHKGPRHDGRKGPDDGPRGAKGQGVDRDGGPATPPSPDAVRASLTDAGYTQIGQILQQGRVTVAQATNPEGEAVLVELAPNGQVVRELNR